MSNQESKYQILIEASNDTANELALGKIVYLNIFSHTEAQFEKKQHLFWSILHTIKNMVSHGEMVRVDGLLEIEVMKHVKIAYNNNNNNNNGNNIHSMCDSDYSQVFARLMKQYLLYPKLVALGVDSQYEPYMEQLESMLIDLNCPSDGYGLSKSFINANEFMRLVLLSTTILHNDK